jgi:hypothetical protein
MRASSPLERVVAPFLLPDLTLAVVLRRQRISAEHCHVAGRDSIELTRARDLRRKDDRENEIPEAGLLNERHSRHGAPDDHTGTLISDKPGLAGAGVD